MYVLTAHIKEVKHFHIKIRTIAKIGANIINFLTMLIFIPMSANSDDMSIGENAANTLIIIMCGLKNSRNMCPVLKLLKKSIFIWIYLP